ncbi:MAG: DUF1573 domain-containing protein [Thermoguttaceae bacterium]|jgi:hypothetical protein
MKKLYVKQILLTVVTTVLLLLSVTPVFAQSSEWAVKMFSELGTERLHDFGSVALHADVEQRFPFKNIYNEDVVISSVSSNCGCTRASVSKQVIRPGETGEVIARVDTSGREHTKQRKATIRVVFSKPTFAEVQVQIKTYIRPDVGFDPGVIEFGTVQQGVGVVKKAYLQYAGRSDWALVGIQKNNPGVRAEAREVRRQRGGVVYEILVELKPDAAPGYIHDLLRFQTNEPDPTNSSVFLPVQGLVVEPMTAKPSFLQLGVVAPEKKVTRNLVISGSQPFRVVEIRSQDPRITGAKTNLSRSVHVLPITFTADSESGAVEGEIEIVTSQSDGSGKLVTLTVPAIGIVLEPDDSADVKPQTVVPVHRDKGIPAMVEFEPAPLERDESAENKGVVSPKVRNLTQEDEVERLLEDDEILEGELVEVMDPQEPDWTPVKQEDLAKRMKTFEKSALSDTTSGEWTSNWTQVRDESPEAVAQDPQVSILK